MLESDKYLSEVRQDEATARSYGITGVPFVVLDGKFGVSGAQPTEVFAAALEQAYAAADPLTVIGGGETCTDDSCPV